MEKNIEKECIYSKIWKQPKCPSTDKWIKNMWCVYIYIYMCMYIYIGMYMYVGIFDDVP